MTLLPGGLLPASFLLPSGGGAARVGASTLRLRETLGDSPRSWTKRRIVGVFVAGQTVRLWGLFTRDDDVVDPDDVTITVRDPSGTSHTPDVTKDADGIYHADITATLGDTDEVWRWKIEGTGTNAQTAFGEFKVIPAPF